MNAQKPQELNSTNFFLINLFFAYGAILYYFSRNLLPGSRNVEADAGVVQDRNTEIVEVEGGQRVSIS